MQTVTKEFVVERPPSKPEIGKAPDIAATSVVLGALMVAEVLLVLWTGWSRCGLATSDNALYTFSFLTLLNFAAFSIVSARERRWFWATMPGKAVVAAVMAETLVGTVLTRVGLPGIMPLPCCRDSQMAPSCGGSLADHRVGEIPP